MAFPRHRAVRAAAAAGGAPLLFIAHEYRDRASHEGENYKQRYYRRQILSYPLKHIVTCPFPSLWKKGPAGAPFPRRCYGYIEDYFTLIVLSSFVASLYLLIKSMQIMRPSIAKAAMRPMTFALPVNSPPNWFIISAVE